ncbi:MAG TPA: PfkB family carbohydrate kinase [Solirubrobacteraceae bacterium]|nr:PfkB family carbohydrate kinase [Solirubrobacteraceae bacterium]
MTSATVALFAPHPLLTVTLEVEGGEDRQSIHFHAGGQGVWVAATAMCMGATPILCGLIGGEPGELLRPLIEKVAGPQTCLVQAASASGCYVTDRRSGKRELLAMKLSDPPSRHELDEIVSLACAQALASGWLVITNPFPAESLPLAVYGDLVADARAGGARTLVDLSSPRLDSALAGEPDLVKLNDWELAEFVRGPVSTPERLLAAAQRVRDGGARSVIVTRGELPALVLHGEQVWQLTPPRFEHGFREGCGDAMMGALAAAWAQGENFERALVSSAAAGAANFLRRGLGHASRQVVEQLADAVTLEPWSPARAAA